jgi:hypothetical protein
VLYQQNLITMPHSTNQHRRAVDLNGKIGARNGYTSSRSNTSTPTSTIVTMAAAAAICAANTFSTWT